MPSSGGASLGQSYLISLAGGDEAANDINSNSISSSSNKSNTSRSATSSTTATTAATTTNHTFSTYDLVNQQLHHLTPSIPPRTPIKTIMRQSSSPVPISSGRFSSSTSIGNLSSNNNSTHNTPPPPPLSQSQFQRAPASMKGSHSSMGLFNANTNSSTTNSIPNPSALSPRIRQTASSNDFGMARSFSNRSSAPFPPLQTSASLSSVVPVYPPTTPDQAPVKPTRATVMKAIEAGKGTLLPDFYSRVGSNNSISSMSGKTKNSNHNSNNDGKVNHSFRSGKRTPRREAPRPSKSASSLNMATINSMRHNMNNNNGKVSQPHSPVLPTHHHQQHHHHVMNTNHAKKESASKTNYSLLRRRAGTSSSGFASSDDDEDGWTNSGRGSARTAHTAATASRMSPYRFTRAKGRRLSLSKLSNCRWGHLLQICIVLAVGFLVWESHHKALFAARQLDQFKEEESLLLLHLQKIERQSIQLHENLARLAKFHNEGGNLLQDPQQQQQQKQLEDSNDHNGGIDLELIEKQKTQLYQMEEELNHEVKALEDRIQQSARSHIIQAFGEGPVQVNLELDFGAADEEQSPINPNKKVKTNVKASRISILLWHDTPHAAWTWLEQIGRHVWDGSEIAWTQSHVIDAVPSRQDPIGAKIEFVEKGQHGHEAWTVGLREKALSEDSGGGMGGLSMYINLQDNTHYHKHETCVGKVIDGYDVLERLLSVSKSNNYDTSSIGIRIKSAVAMHVTKKNEQAQQQ